MTCSLDRCGWASAAALLALGSSLRAATAGAQDARPARDTAAGADSVQLEAVTITALRTSLPMALAPFPVSILGARELGEGRPGLSLEEALRGVPGLQVDNRHNYALGERISIRGAGARAQFGVRGVRVLVDGIPATMPDGQTTLNHLDPLTLAAAQVVRGPVSSLYGNASGGAILLETALPEGVELSAGAGGHGLRRARATAGGRMGGVRAGVSVAGLDYAGHRAHAGAENRYANARVAWDGARDALQLTIATARYDALNPGSLSDSLWRVDPRMAFAGNVNARTGERGEHVQLGALWRHAVGSMELETAGWAIGRELDNPIPARIVRLDRRARGARALLRGALARTHWTLGAEVERQDDDRENYQNVSGEEGTLLLDQRERVTGLGLFAQGAATLGPRTTLLAGVRHDRTRFAVDDHFVTGSDPDDSGARVMRAWSPAGGVTFQVADGVALYANGATAFETPTTTELANRPDGAGGFNPGLEPQKTLSFEAGTRASLAAAVSLQLAAYRSTVRDALVPFEVPGVPGRQFFRNAGRTRVQGIEASLALRASERLRAELAYTLSDARFRDFTVGGTSYAGNRVPGVPPHRVDGSLTAELPRGTFAALDARAMTRTPANDANDAHAPAYVATDLRAGLRERAVGPVRVSLSAGIQNAFATRYSSSLAVNAFGRRYFEPAPGRTAYVGTVLRM